VKAIRQHVFGGPEQLRVEEVPDPEPAAHEVLAGDILAPEEISKLAEIESRDVLLAKIAGAGRAPMYAAAGMFASFTRNAATMFGQLLDKKESGESAAAGSAEEPTATADEPVETDTADKAEEE
jgi:large subunit ribosomal protein L10